MSLSTSIKALKDLEFCGYLCRLYTGIHALKPKPKSKTGAISESTTALIIMMMMIAIIIIKGCHLLDVFKHQYKGIEGSGVLWLSMQALYWNPCSQTKTKV
eukprot:TRINITY_DN27416_c1_g1_i1.p1 TRINITY_DN27416_c1_g1~~TRINITY_DN27416_c1_g1_i1.p1  ORF type:complete len:101 (+),score=6.47 TRINITY_DN27416_c1_g1_i1:501-803(+)